MGHKTQETPVVYSIVSIYSWMVNNVHWTWVVFKAVTCYTMNVDVFATYRELEWCTLQSGGAQRTWKVSSVWCWHMEHNIQGTLEVVDTVTGYNVYWRCVAFCVIRKSLSRLSFERHFRCYAKSHLQYNWTVYFTSQKVNPKVWKDLTTVFGVFEVLDSNHCILNFPPSFWNRKV